MKKNNNIPATSEKNYTELVLSAYNKRIEENHQKIQKNKEALTKLLDIEAKQGKTPELQTRIDKIWETIHKLEKEEGATAGIYSPPWKIKDAANRIDDEPGYALLRPYVIEMNNAILKFTDQLNKFKNEFYNRGGAMPLNAMHVLETTLSDLHHNFSHMFAQYTVDVESLKLIVEEYLEKRIPDINKDASYLDDLIKTFTE